MSASLLRSRSLPLSIAKWANLEGGIGATTTARGVRRKDGGEDTGAPLWGRERTSKGTRGQTTGEWKGEGRGREKQRRDNTRGWESLPANLIMGGALSFLQNIGKKICLRLQGE